jgi:hypothetical protein
LIGIFNDVIVNEHHQSNKEKDITRNQG